uniref:Cytochrome P450 71A1-like n=1 Tax=Nelumbo nucifera TaxID=4432 RepID=A0A822Z9N7_NELNU|nr:TPA_asm: hypothetical protein HUJ06_016095 [Nelumbo nucifera]
MSLLGMFSVRDFFPYLGWINTVTGLDRRLKRTSQELDKLPDQVIRDHVTTIVIEDQRSKDQRDAEDFLDILLQAHKDSTLDIPIPITRDNIKAIILDMFIGGSDTTAITMEWSMTEIVSNPKVMRKAQEEVRRIVGKKSKFEKDDIPQMAYLKVVIKETLTLHPPAPFLILREATVSQLKPESSSMFRQFKERLKVKRWENPKR